MHFLSYHDTEKTGYCVSNLSSDGAFAAFSNNEFFGLLGSVVWVVSGTGEPRVFRLEHCFAVDGCELVAGDQYLVVVYGGRGIVYTDGIVLNRCSWLPSFFASQRDFVEPLSRIGADFVPRMYQVIREAGYSRSSAIEPMRHGPAALQATGSLAF